MDGLACVDSIGKDIPNLRETRIAIIKDPTPFSIIPLPTARVLHRPIEIGRIHLKNPIIDEIIHVDPLFHQHIVLIQRKIGFPHPLVQINPIGAVAMLQFLPVFDNVALIGVNVVMVVQITLIRGFLKRINAPIFSIDEKYCHPCGQHIQAQIASYFLRQGVLYSSRDSIATTERFQYQMLETFNGYNREKMMFEAFFPILLLGQNLEVLLLYSAR